MNKQPVNMFLFAMSKHSNLSYEFLVDFDAEVAKAYNTYSSLNLDTVKEMKQNEVIGESHA